NTAMSRAEIFLAPPPNSGLDLALTIVGVIPWRRSSARSRLAVRAICSPFITLPRLSRPCQTNSSSAFSRCASAFSRALPMAALRADMGLPSILGNAVDLDEAGDPLFHLVQRGTPQIADAAALGSLGQLLDITTSQHDLLD